MTFVIVLAVAAVGLWFSPQICMFLLRGKRTK